MLITKAQASQFKQWLNRTMFSGVGAIMRADDSSPMQRVKAIRYAKWDYTNARNALRALRIGKPDWEAQNLQLQSASIAMDNAQGRVTR